MSARRAALICRKRVRSAISASPGEVASEEAPSDTGELGSAMVTEAPANSMPKVLLVSKLRPAVVGASSSSMPSAKNESALAEVDLKKAGIAARPARRWILTAAGF